MNILIVEDDAQELKEVLPVCSKEDLVQTAGTCQEAMCALENAWPEVIISDAIFPAQATEYPDRYKAFMIGILLDKLRTFASQRSHQRKKLPKVILISGAPEAAENFSEIAAWLAEGRLYDVVPKAGFGSWEFFRAVLSHRLNGLRRDVRFAGVLQNADIAFREMAACGIVTQHPSMLRMWEIVKSHSLQASHTTNLFITGEAGVGKDLVAQAVADLKGCKSKYRAFNCNVPEGLFLSQLVGTMPGAFPNAMNTPGLVEQAGDGVLFLDQFCSISSTNQFQLLRLLEEKTREYSRLGGTEIKSARCKFVIADNVSPKVALSAAATDQKRLIEEMYYRVGLDVVTVPSLRARREDIPLLTSTFLAQLNSSHGQVSLDEEVVDRFCVGPWKGNVRALYDIVKKIVRDCSGCVSWAQVCSLFDPGVLSAEVGEVPIIVRRGNRDGEEVLGEQIRARLSDKGQKSFEMLQQRLHDPSTKLDLDSYHVYKLLDYLCADRSKTVRASDSATVLGIAESQFKKVVCVLFESPLESYKKYHLVTMVKEERDGKALKYLLVGDLYA